MATDVARLAMEFTTDGAGRVRKDLQGVKSDADKVTQSSTRASQATRKLGPAAAASANGLRQASMQISQIAQQTSATGNFVQSLAIQLPDLALGLGPIGILAGAAAGGLLAYAASAFNADENSEELADTIDYLSGRLVNATDGTRLLSEEMRDLAKISADAARIELIIDTQKARSTAISASNAVLDAFKSITGENPLLPDTIYSDRLGEISDVLNITREDAEALADALPRTADRSQEAYQNLLGVVAEIADKYGASSREVLDLAEALNASSVSAIRAIKAEEDLQSALEETGKLLERSADSADGVTTAYEAMVDANDEVLRFVETLQMQADTISLTARETALYKLQRLEANGADEEAVKLARQQINASFDKIEAFRREEERLKLLREQYRITAAEDPLLQRIAAQDRGQQIIESIRQEAVAVRNGLDQELAIRQAHKDRVIALDDALRLGVIDSAEERNRLEVESLRQRNDQIRQLEAQKYQIQTQTMTNTLSATDQFLGNLAAISQAGGEKSFEVYKALASAQAAIAATLSVVSVLGDPTVPAFLKVPLATSIGALAAVQVAQIQSQEYQGSYLGGGFTGTGPRTGGVDGKGGFPAILHPNETVIDHTRGQGMGGDTIINIVNAPPGTRTETRQDSDGRQVIDIFIADMVNGGPMSKSIQGTFAGLRRQGR